MGFLMKQIKSQVSFEDDEDDDNDHSFSRGGRYIVSTTSTPPPQRTSKISQLKKQFHRYKIKSEQKQLKFLKRRNLVSTLVIPSLFFRGRKGKPAKTIKFVNHSINTDQECNNDAIQDNIERKAGKNKVKMHKREILENDDIDWQMKDEKKTIKPATTAKITKAKKFLRRNSKNGGDANKKQPVEASRGAEAAAIYEDSKPPPLVFLSQVFSSSSEDSQDEDDDHTKQTTRTSSTYISGWFSGSARNTGNATDGNTTTNAGWFCATFPCEPIQLCGGDRGVDSSSRTPSRSNSFRIRRRKGSSSFSDEEEQKKSISYETCFPCARVELLQQDNNGNKSIEEDESQQRSRHDNTYYNRTRLDTGEYLSSHHSSKNKKTKKKLLLKKLRNKQSLFDDNNNNAGVMATTKSAAVQRIVKNTNMLNCFHHHKSH